MPRVSAARRETYVKERREQILDAAIEVFSKKGFDGANVADIATAAKLGKGTVYLYFKSKEAIFDAIIAERTLVSQLDTLIVDGLTLEEQLRAIAQRLLEFEHAHMPVLRLLVADANRFPEHAEHVYRDIILRGNLWLAEFLTQQAKAGRIRPLKNPLITARALISMIISYMLTQEVFGGARYTPIDDEEWIDTVVSIFMNGVRPDCP
jgi:AcrR family transcriptional regulator